MTIKPIGNYVVLLQDEPEKPVGGIIMTGVAGYDDNGEKPRQSGIVLSVGDKCETLKVGDHVLFQHGEFQRIKDAAALHNGQPVLLVCENKVIGIFESDKNE